MAVSAAAAPFPRTARPVEVPFAQRLAARLTGSPWFWALFISVGFVVPILRTIHRQLPAPPPVVGTFPAFALVDQEARPFASDALAGRISIVEFVSEEALEAGAVSPLASLQRRVRNAGPLVHLVSFVRSAANGKTPGATALGVFGAKAHAGAWRWTLAAGDVSALERDARAALGNETLVGKLLLVDGRLRVRRIVTPSRENVDLLMRDIGLLVNLETTPTSPAKNEGRK
jgi:hypothetical protein